MLFFYSKLNVDESGKDIYVTATAEYRENKILFLIFFSEAQSEELRLRGATFKVDKAVKTQAALGILLIAN